MNRKFLRVVGMQRSGIHAVAEWIRMSLADQHGYSFQFDNAIPMDKPNEFAKYLPPKGDLAEPFLWMVEHEDINFIDMPVLNPKLHTNFEYADVLVIRDVFNTMASRRKMNANLFSRRAVQLWKQYAAEALNGTDFLGPNKIVVAFNKWHDSRWSENTAFITAVGDRFGISGGGVLLDKLSVGSSFEPPTTLAKDLKVFDRWQTYADDPAFWAVFDQQVLALNTKLFGENPEVLKHLK